MHCLTSTCYICCLLTSQAALAAYADNEWQRRAEAAEAARARAEAKAAEAKAVADERAGAFRTALKALALRAFVWTRLWRRRAAGAVASLVAVTALVAPFAEDSAARGSSLLELQLGANNTAVTAGSSHSGTDDRAGDATATGDINCGYDDNQEDDDDDEQEWQYGPRIEASSSSGDRDGVAGRISLSSASARDGPSSTALAAASRRALPLTLPLTRPELAVYTDTYCRLARAAAPLCRARAPGAAGPLITQAAALAEGLRLPLEAALRALAASRALYVETKIYLKYCLIIFCNMLF